MPVEPLDARSMAAWDTADDLLSEKEHSLAKEFIDTIEKLREDQGGGLLSDEQEDKIISQAKSLVPGGFEVFVKHENLVDTLLRAGLDE